MKIDYSTIKMKLFINIISLKMEARAVSISEIGKDNNNNNII